MAKRLQYRRLLCLVLLLGTAFAGLGYRLVDLQVLRHVELRAMAQLNTQREILLEPRRGDILDARGNQLATSVFVKTVAADPVLLGDCQAKVARVIAPLLELNEGELYNRLLPRTRVNDKGQTVTNRYVVLKRKVAVETWEKITEAMGRLTFTTNEVKLSPKSFGQFCRDLRAKAVFTDPINDQKRVYPNTNLAAHVLGFVGMDERDVNGTKILETTGKDGIESTLNSKLAGVRGWRMTETDSKQRELVALRDQDVEARDGLNVVLTIDSVIQNMLETALAGAMKEHTPISISGIAVRPRTGEILALATLPTFDPNNPGSASPDARRNRVISDLIEPGSTFKIVVVSGALNDSVVTLNDQFDCENGAFSFAGRVLHDHERYGVLSVERIITKSSNIGAAKIGIKLGPDRLFNHICDFGFGQRTGIPLPGEVRGISYAPKDWSKVTIAQIPMGHGICVTRLQMTMAMCAIANNGALMRPMLVDRLEDREGRTVVKYAPQKVRNVITPQAAGLMRTALKTVVTSEGTAAKAALENYSVAGKTGTAQKVENGQYVKGKYISSFIGFFPADNPELCISIVMDEPKNGYYGGLTAAPVFKEVAERAGNYLNIRPDLKDFQPSTSATIAAAPDRPIRTVAARPLNHQ
ncbi:MAG: penicillin-binding protein 2 [Pedosphaera sp.]|nr:penicillin-binding protein 2 [Pedosphaera sp.]